MNVKIAAIKSRMTMMEMVAAKPLSEKANMAILSEGPSANKSESFYANIEQEAFKLHNLSVKENTTLSPSPEKIYTNDSISILELNRSNIIKACNTPGVMDIKNKDDFILDVVRAIERYCQVLKHKNIYIRFFSACPEWEDEEDRLLPVSHVIRIATTSKHFQPEKGEAHETTPEDTIKMITFRRAK
ncbi:Hypothetical predicted protein [Olea europaea subsp. europaea]|uniref:Uncharacterized protein n=1 Tax=Olea europaea subsp. europaea TaxID=158383 RepID=A0A8S0U272_OLEEU|nr:Hypothetical predicted protein [Olea europaea subsp. europaea]